MRPQTAIALVTGAVLGIAGTWMVLQPNPQPEDELDADDPPPRIRPKSSVVRKLNSPGRAHDRETPGSIHSSDKHTPQEKGKSQQAHSISARGIKQGGTPIHAPRESSANSSHSASYRETLKVIQNLSNDDQIVDPNDDGSSTLYQRVGQKVVRSDFTHDSILIQRVLYQIGGNGSLVSYDVFNSTGIRRYRATLGYSKRSGPTFGKLVVEKIFDVHDPSFFQHPDDSGNLVPRSVFDFIYSYDSNGSPKAPVGSRPPTGESHDSIIEFGGVAHVLVPLARLEPHIVQALNRTYPVKPALKP